MRLRWFVFLTLLCVANQSANAEHRRRIYFLESLSPVTPAAVRTIDAFKQRLREKTTESFDVYVDYMELVRFPSQAHADRTAQYLAGKYSEVPPDLLIALGRAAVPFMTKYRDAIAPGIPTIMASVPSDDIKVSSLRDVYWVGTEYNFSKTLDLARRLQPNARHLVVVGGGSHYDAQWLEYARSELRPYSDQFDIKYIAGRSYEETLAEVSQLPKDSIVIMSFFFADGSGQLYTSPDVAANVATASPAPVYSPISTNLGKGIVGGYMDSWEEEGAAAADVALEILSGKSLDTVSRQNTPLHTYKIDERQLKRWQLSSARLPSGADIRFHQFDLWEQYHWQILGILAILLAQAGAITILFLERRRRRVAESEMRQSLLEVLHLNRTAVAGTLSSSFAHELNQPLAAIQSNADAALLYLKQSPPNVAKIEKILTSILQDDKRAASIIAHLRGLLKKKDAVEGQECDLNDIISDTMEVISSEALKNRVNLAPYNPNGALPVFVDRIQLQQVLVNLAMNGIEAMRDCDPVDRKMSINTALVSDSSIEVSVADTGHGIPTDQLDKIFDAFYTTKSDGTGLGLSIAQKIIETFGGRIWAENRPARGSLFRFTLPLLKTARTVDD
jgi:signal transduction histidine kinase